MDDLKNMWDSAKESARDHSVDLSAIISLAKKRKTQTVNAHVLNLAILVSALIGISAFFWYVTYFKGLLGQVGSGLMVGGLALRIIIELISFHKSSKIDLSKEALQSNNEALIFYEFRKRIHGPISISIIALYTIGFYMLTPEFSQYFSFEMMALIDISYVVYLIVILWSMIKGNRKEIESLEVIIQLQSEMKEESID